jgi:hypothetical protein
MEGLPPRILQRVLRLPPETVLPPDARIRKFICSHRHGIEFNGLIEEIADIYIILATSTYNR